MGALDGLEVVAGLALTAATLSDIFTTILVPEPTRGLLRVGARVRRLAMPVARLSWRRKRARRTNRFAPAIFILAFAAWMLLLLLGFGLLAHAARHRFMPVLDVGDAFYVAGSSLLTLGLSEVDAHGVARWLILATGLSGFAVVTATISYILQIQSALHQRESRVLTLGSLAGSPPSGLRLLEAASELNVAGELETVFRTWRDWAAAVLHSHVSSPVLIYFHSVDRESDWLVALEAVLDAATLLMALTEHEARGAATLMHRVGSRTAAQLTNLLEMEDAADLPLDEAAVAAIAGALRRAGFAIRPVDRARTAAFNALRADYAGRIAALAALLGAERPLPFARFRRP